MLPEVTKEVANEVFAALVNPENVRTSWREMIEQNRELFISLEEVAITAAAKEYMNGEMFLRGAMCVWESLRVQDEVDDNQQGENRIEDNADELIKLAKSENSIFIKIGTDRGGADIEYGPYSLDIIKKLFKENRINGKTFVFFTRNE